MDNLNLVRNDHLRYGRVNPRQKSEEEENVDGHCSTTGQPSSEVPMKRGRKSCCGLDDYEIRKKN